MVVWSFFERKKMKTILVVDDESVMRQIIEEALSGEYAVASVTNGREAQALLAEKDFDLVITDLVMPGMNGIDLLMGLQKTKPKQKIIAISGGGGINGRFDYLPVAQLIGASIVLRKPFQMVGLRSAVHELLS